MLVSIYKLWENNPMLTEPICNIIDILIFWICTIIFISGSVEQLCQYYISDILYIPPQTVFKTALTGAEDCPFQGKSSTCDGLSACIWRLGNWDFNFNLTNPPNLQVIMHSTKYCNLWEVYWWWEWEKLKVDDVLDEQDFRPHDEVNEDSTEQIEPKQFPCEEGEYYA